MKKIYKILLLIVLSSCGKVIKDNSNQTRETPLASFQMTITDYNFSMAYGVQYVLTEKDLKIVFKGEVEGEKDTVLYSKNLLRNEILVKLSELDLNALKEQYEDPCIDDGSQILVKFKKGEKSKIIQLSNFYQEDIGLAIELINQLTPDQYNIWYDKEKLLEEQENCK